MSYSLIASTIAGSSGGGDVTTSNIDTSGADFIIAWIGGLGNLSSSIQDSKSNTWTELTLSSDASGLAGQLFYVSNPIVGAGHNFSSTTWSFPSIAVEAWAGSKSSPFDVQNASHGSVTTIQPGSVTPSEDNELLVSGLVLNGNNGGSDSIDSSFTISNQNNLLGGNHFGIAIAHLVQGTAAAKNPTWSWDGSTQIACTSIATFKASASVTTRIVRLLASLGVGR